MRLERIGSHALRGGVKAVIEDIIGHGNEGCVVAGHLGAQPAARCAKNGGLLFSEAEIKAFNELATEARKRKWNLQEFAVANS